jgi:hypothetical protein
MHYGVTPSSCLGDGYTRLRHPSGQDEKRRGFRGLRWCPSSKWRIRATLIWLGDEDGLRLRPWINFYAKGVAREEVYIGASSIHAAQGLQTYPISNLHQESMIFGWIQKGGKISIGFDSRSIQGRVWRGVDLRRGSLPRAGQCSVEMV